VVRSRTSAAALADAGHVRINGVRASGSSHPVRIGDVLTIALDRRVRLMKVTAFAQRRGTADAAAALFEEVSNDSLQ
jgi:ribosome-associated heat shock protein Hsp15